MKASIFIFIFCWLTNYSLALDIVFTVKYIDTRVSDVETYLNNRLIGKSVEGTIAVSGLKEGDTLVFYKNTPCNPEKWTWSCEEPAMEYEYVIKSGSKDTSVTIPLNESFRPFPPKCVAISQHTLLIESIQQSNEIFSSPVQANFPGGPAGERLFLEENLKIPKDVQEEYLKGKCSVLFIVEKDGSLTDVKVIKKVPNCPECDEELLRVAKKMTFLEPAEYMGVKVRSYYRVNCFFGNP